MNNTFRRAIPHYNDHEFDGRQRVVIENISPELGGGKYTAKVVEGERLVVEADIFVDGADTICAELCVRQTGRTEWQRSPMAPLGNDRWQGSFTVGIPGGYDYTIEAWVDHFQTWRRGLAKKIEAGQDVSLDLQIGALFVEKGAARAEQADAEKITLSASLICSRNKDEAIAAALDGKLEQLMNHHPDKEHATVYEKVLGLRVEQKKAGCSAWYELFPRSWSPVQGKHGTFKDCNRLLPLIAGMGFDVLYLPPIHPIGYTKRKGKNNALVAASGDPGSCWAIGNQDGGHKAVHPELGTLKDFTTFVTEAEKYGISVALDIAFQCSPDHPYVKEHPQWFKWRPDGSVQFAENPPKRYEDILPLDFESADWQNLWIELKSIFLFWIEKGVKIFRVDNPHTKAFPFWEWTIASIRAEHPDVVFLAEAFTRPKLMSRLAMVGYSQSYSYFTWRNNKYELQEYLLELTSSPLKNVMRPNFWPNTPDILHEEFQSGDRNRFIIRLLLAATLSSNYGMYGPAYELCEHVPVPGSKEDYLDSEKYEIKWWDLDRPGNIRAEITRVNRIRKENAALQQTNDLTFVRIEASPGKEHDQLMGYVKRSVDDNNIIFVVVNLDSTNTQGGWLRFPLELFNMPHDYPFKVEDLLTGACYDWNGEWNYVEVNPWAMPAHIFRVTLT
ncbi:MAG: alpha-1,4-glucan--maltose-1-phosphate maltosyltransferase [Chlorobiales bacterium]|nr:alpha-1,4-glucan--maltose-1-phosphate maltosyltransferase [Chlorobiales bacterium]